jgi:hypothetical protein
MKFGKKSLILLATVAALLIAAVPAMAAPRFNTVELQVRNETSESVELVLNGPEDTQTVFLNAGQTLKVEVAPGTYFYKYEACGLMTRDITQVTDDGDSLVLTKCAGIALSNIDINNKTGAPIIVTLTGAGGVFGYWVPPGGINIQIPAGGYSFTSVACSSESGTIKASARLSQPLIWTWTCQGAELSGNAE